MSTLTVNVKAVAYGDPQQSNNPLRKHFDWTRGLSISVQNPKSDREENVLPGASHSFFDGTRVTTLAGDTAFTISQSTTESTRYRFTHVAGTNPGLRTNRNLALAGQTLTVTSNSDETVTLSVGGASWLTTAAGDTVFFPGISTGDSAGAVNVLNEGEWVVIAVISATIIQCARPSGTVFQASSEVVPITSNSQVRAFSASGVQKGDKVSITAAFAAVTQKTFAIDRVTELWFEVVSTTAIPIETAKTPGAAGMVFYTNAKRFLRIETTQEIVVRLNGSTDDSVRVSPVEPGSVEQTGWFEKWGPVWSLTVINKSSQNAVVDTFSAE